MKSDNSQISFWRKFRKIGEIFILSICLVIAIILAIRVFPQNGAILQKINVILLIFSIFYNIIKSCISIFRQEKKTEQQSELSE